jgi:type II secretory pathway pseudopilin PulG
LLVVITIILLVSVLALTTIPGLVGEYQVTEGARLVQAALASARDAAIRTGDNHGIRLVYDPTLSDEAAKDPSTASLTLPPTGPHSRLVFNKIVPIEPAPDLSEGKLTFVPAPLNWIWTNGAPPTYPIGPVPPNVQTGLTTLGVGNTYPFFNFVQAGTTVATALSSTNPILMVVESVFQGNTALPVPLPNPPANWFWNVRIGDKLRFNDSGQYYTIVGPMRVSNPELYVNNGPPGAPVVQTESLSLLYPLAGGGTITVNPQYLFLVNGVDDNGNGYVDEGFNGLDENYDGSLKPVDDIGEWYGVTPIGVGVYPPEIEKWQGSQVQQSTPVAASGFPQESGYTIKRRPVPSQGAREFLMPSTVVIDATTWNASTVNLLPERSRLPAPVNGTIDIMLNPSGQVIPTTIYSTPAGTSMSVSNAFYHFWIADRADVYDPAPNNSNAFTFPMLPFPESVGGYNPPTNPVNSTLAGRFLKKDRQLVTLFTRTGQVVTNSINNFNLSSSPPLSTDANFPYYEAQQGIREAK